MITRRLGATLVALPLAVSLAACGSSITSGTPVTSGPTSAGSAAGSSVPSSGTSAPSSGDSQGSSGGGSSAPSGQSDNPAELVATMTAALNKVTSLTFRSETGLGGAKITGTGKQKISGSKLVALDVQQTLPTGTSTIIVVDGKSYIKQPGITTDPGKPYRLITSTSSDPLVRQLAKTLEQTLNLSSVGQAKIYLDATKSIRKIGTEKVGGTDTTHYKLVVDAAKIGKLLGTDVSASGIGDIPVDLYLDPDGRPVRTDTTVSAGGQTITSSFLITGYNVPVTITAPPASEVTR